MKALAPLVLPPLSALYSAITKTRTALYRWGTFPVLQLESPVISVGNITVGGTGKTPLVEWVARVLAREGRKVCILTRGYGRANANRRVLVTKGSDILATPAEAGDEAFLLAKNLRGYAAVISDADRVSAGRWAIDDLGVDTLVLDDGFQHLQLARDLDIVTIDATNAWGGGKLLPYGRLREPLTELRRANCIVITRTEQVEDLDALRLPLMSFGGNQPVFLSRMQVRGYAPLSRSAALESGSGPTNPIAAFCAVGNPQSFFDHLQRQGHEIPLKKAFPDHHFYKQQEIEALMRESKKLGVRSLITTAKDAVKLRSFAFEIPCFVLEINIAIEQEDKLLNLMLEAISKKESPMA